MIFGAAPHKMSFKSTEKQSRHRMGESKCLSHG